MTHRREDDKTIGEVYRRLVDMDERTEKKLDRIEEQVRMTNGRTTRLEANYAYLNSEIAHLRQPPPTPPSLPVTTADGESLSIKASISPKMWAGIVSGAAAIYVLVQMFAKWFLEK